MIKYGKTMQHAISAISRLAEVYNIDPQSQVSSADVAASRSLPKTLVAKVLTILSQYGLVHGSPGPGGGYRLARPPAEISLYQIALLFERFELQMECPFGRGKCNDADPCPMHVHLTQLETNMLEFLKTTTLNIFVTAHEIMDGTNNSLKSCEKCCRDSREGKFNNTKERSNHV